MEIRLLPNTWAEHSLVLSWSLATVYSELKILNPDHMRSIKGEGWMKDVLFKSSDTWLQHRPMELGMGFRA